MHKFRKGQNDLLDITSNRIIDNQLSYLFVNYSQDSVHKSFWQIAEQIDLPDTVVLLNPMRIQTDIRHLQGYPPINNTMYIQCNGTRYYLNPQLCKVVKMKDHIPFSSVWVTFTSLLRWSCLYSAKLHMDLISSFWV